MDEHGPTTPSIAGCPRGHLPGNKPAPPGPRRNTTARPHLRQRTHLDGRVRAARGGGLRRARRSLRRGRRRGRDAGARRPWHRGHRSRWTPRRARIQRRALAPSGAQGRPSRQRRVGRGDPAAARGIRGRPARGFLGDGPWLDAVRLPRQHRGPALPGRDLSGPPGRSPRPRRAPGAGEHAGAPARGHHAGHPRSGGRADRA